LPHLLARGHDVVYRVAGEGDDRPRLEALARECGVAGRVRFLGAVPRPALPALYRAADLFVLPSRGEGFGIVFLEAMACGTPALGLAEGGAVDPLAGLGRAVPSEALAESIAAELARTAAGRDEAERRALAGRVRARFGRPLFEEGVAYALARLGAGPSLPAAHPGLHA
jgi:phosphatidylinositol alpha-1,6-mannosyltransferase